MRQHRLASARIVAASFSVGDNYSAFTNSSLVMMYEAIRGALASDDAFEAARAKFRVRTTTEWKRHAGNLEAEILKRGMTVSIIDWTNDQGSLPFE
jgi:hypothetical protein